MEEGARPLLRKEMDGMGVQRREAAKACPYCRHSLDKHTVDEKADPPYSCCDDCWDEDIVKGYQEDLGICLYPTPVQA